MMGQSMISPIDVSYIADTIFMLRFFEARRPGEKGVVGGEEAHRQTRNIASAKSAS